MPSLSCIDRRQTTVRQDQGGTGSILGHSIPKIKPGNQGTTEGHLKPGFGQPRPSNSIAELSARVTRERGPE